MIETSGYKLDKDKNKLEEKPPKKVADANEKLSVSEAKNEIDMKLKAAFKEGEALLT